MFRSLPKQQPWVGLCVQCRKEADKREGEMLKEKLEQLRGLGPDPIVTAKQAMVREREAGLFASWWSTPQSSEVRHDS